MTEEKGVIESIIRITKSLTLVQTTTFYLVQAIYSLAADREDIGSARCQPVFILWNYDGIFFRALLFCRKPILREI